MNVRIPLGIGGAVALIGLGIWSVGPGKIRAPGIVQPALEYRVEHTGDGRVRWRLLDGSVPGGPVSAAEGVVIEERGSPIEITIATAATHGSAVRADTPIATVSAPALAAAAAAMAAEEAAATADLEALEAGGRTGVVRAAQAQVKVARANLGRAERAAAILDKLADAGSVGAWEAELARMEARVQQNVLVAAEAAVLEARDAPLEAEINAAAGRVRAAAARTEEASLRAAGATLASPFSGTVVRPGGDVLVAVQSAGPTLIQIAVAEAQHADVNAGDPVRFVPTAGGEPVVGQVLALSDAASLRDAGPGVWAVAKLDGPVPAGATGVAEIGTWGL